MRDYVRRYYREGSQPSKDDKIIIRDVTDRSLRTILFTFGRMAGGAALHVANRSYYAACLRMPPTEGVQLVRRNTFCDERIVDQDKEREVEELWVWFYFDRLCLGEDTSDAAAVHCTRFTFSY